MKIIDITLPLSNQTLVWEGDKKVIIEQIAFIQKGSDFNISRAELGVHAGTHIDAPYHLDDQGYSVDKIPLDKLIGPVQVLEIDHSINLITKEVLLESGYKKGTERLLLKTKNTEYWNMNPNQFIREYTAINSTTATFFVDESIKLVGIDYFSISPYNDLKTPHQILLNAGIVILENAFLVNVEPGEYMVYCLPLYLVGTDGAPVRAVLTKE
jgi:arylformamidase